MPVSKLTQHSVASHTKHSNNSYPKSLYSISDVNKLYRREETFKKKLKMLIETNSLLQARIKIYESSIKDERSTILFQLNQLSKTMNSKTSTYTDEKLDQQKFKNNEQAVETIKEMIAKFQIVEKQTKVTKKVYQSMNSIFERYQQYSDQINSLVKMTQKSNKEYEDGMKNMLFDKQNQIITKRQSNQEIYENTQNMTRKIDEFDNQRLKLIDEEASLEKYIQKLKKTEQEIQLDVDKFTEWAEIVIDKNHRKNFNKEGKQKEAQLNRLSQNNKKLQVYLKQLENEEEILRQQWEEKENQTNLNNTHKAKSFNKQKLNRTVTVQSSKAQDQRKSHNVLAL